MKLSEAIRLGAMLHPQTHWYREYHPSTKEVCGCCALGGASLATGIDTSTSCDDHLVKTWPFIHDTFQYKHPIYGYMQNIRAIITSLNNPEGLHRWTRERIADWVSTIEPQEAPTEPVTESQEIYGPAPADPR